MSRAPKWDILREIDVIVVDIDGTITDDKGFIDPQAIIKIRELERNGVMVSLASGNALPVTKGLATYIGASGPVIAESGCVIEMLGEIYVYGDPEETKRALEQINRRFYGRIHESWSNLYRHVDIAIRPTVPKHMLEETIDTSKIVILDSKFAYHIHPRGIDKGTAIHKIAELLNLDEKYIASIGDSELDIPMLRESGYGVALSNSPKELKEIADYITKGSYSAGFIEFADILINAKREGLGK